MGWESAWTCLRYFGAVISGIRVGQRCVWQYCLQASVLLAESRPRLATILPTPPGVVALMLVSLVARRLVVVFVSVFVGLVVLRLNIAYTLHFASVLLPRLCLASR